jgi:L-ascorbate metabolism protein UlaG (beta-lactamase superfamily)
MKLKWLGHSSFVITSEKGSKIITDPYTVGGGIHYGPIDESADVVTISHEHGDHNGVASVGGTPKVIKGKGTVLFEDIIVRGISSDHDETQGSQRGKNTIFCFTVDGINVCHLGDLGTLLNDTQIAEIGEVDILLIPVGGYFTIDASKATAVYQSLNPRVAIPMHFKTPKCNFPITTADDFLKGKKNLLHSKSSEVEYKKNGLPREHQVIELQYYK